MSVIVVSMSGAAGAWLGGLSVDLTGSFEALLAGALLLQFTAILALRWQAKALTSCQASPGNK